MVNEEKVESNEIDSYSNAWGRKCEPEVRMQPPSSTKSGPVMMHYLEQRRPCC